VNKAIRSILFCASAIMVAIAVAVCIDLVLAPQPASAAYNNNGPGSMIFGPMIPKNVTLVGGTSNSVTFKPGGVCIRFDCSTAVTYRTGVLANGAVTAVATDNDLPVSTIEKMCFTAGGFNQPDDTIAFLGASSGTCKVAQLNSN
jgi:hypothetical protein